MPSVILLIVLGWIVRQISFYWEIAVPNLMPILPILGTVGLILIVLEGSLELELNRSKIKLINKSLWVALLPVFILAFLLDFAFQYFGYPSFKDNLANIIPLCIISSAIAIPSARFLTSSDREFVVYESSLSDIIGILFFNFITLNTTIDVFSFGHFIRDFTLMVIISFMATIGLAFLLKNIGHHVKFVPIILLVILIYSVSKIYHLPSLVFILILGIFLGNLDELKSLKWIAKLNPDSLNREVNRLKELTAEMTFLIRTLFFLLFGYLLETPDILNEKTALWALGIVIAIYAIRAIHLKLFGFKLYPLLYIAPRGLITILLYLSIPVTQQIDLVSKSLIIQVIILTALVMMVGLMTMPKVRDEVETLDEKIAQDSEEPSL
ncbi:sodium:proton antiporter [Spirosoma sp.]|uniref:sodium:proton antiporter n=1 Tax=Spirosoma sp. TaxID=1899569 RepID=UPI003B3A5AE3